MDNKVTRDVKSSGRRTTQRRWPDVIDDTKHEQVEEKVKQTANHLGLIIETVPHGIEEIDLSGIITLANSALHRLYEYGKGELIGKSVLEIVPSDSERESLRDYLKILVNEQPLPVPYYGQKKTKKGRIVDVKVDWNYKRDNQERPDS